MDSEPPAWAAVQHIDEHARPDGPTTGSATPRQEPGRHRSGRAHVPVSELVRQDRDQLGPTPPEAFLAQQPGSRPRRRCAEQDWSRSRERVVSGALVVIMLLAGAGITYGALVPGAATWSSDALPPPDTSPFGATGAVPGSGVTRLPGAVPEAGLPSAAGPAGIPIAAQRAYEHAETRLDTLVPGCRLSWALVAGIGKVESDHARGGRLDATGATIAPILGPELDGTHGNAAIADTDEGALDGDTRWDRAVGPTQFLPSTWQTWGTDADGDGRSDPEDIDDAANATGRYLCAGQVDISTPGGAHDAVFRYNHSEAYVARVLAWARAYSTGAVPPTDPTGSAPPGDVQALDTPAGVASGSPVAEQPLPAAPAPGLPPAPAPVAPGARVPEPGTAPIRGALPPRLALGVTPTPASAPVFPRPAPSHTSASTPAPAGRSTTPAGALQEQAHVRAPTVPSPPVPTRTATPLQGTRRATDRGADDPRSSSLDTTRSGLGALVGSVQTEGAPRPGIIPGPTGRAAGLQFVLPSGGRRAEVLPPLSEYHEGDHLWLHYRAQLSDLPVGTRTWQLIAQLHQEAGTGSPPVALEVGDGQLRLANRGGRQQSLGVIDSNGVIDVVLRVAFSRDPATARIDVWRDGRVVLADYHPPAATLSDGSAYLKLGLYRDPVITQSSGLTITELQAGPAAAAVGRPDL